MESRDPEAAARKFEHELNARQRNLYFPHTVRNTVRADAFLWRGSPAPTRVQRIGAWLFGFVFLGFGVSFFMMGRELGSRPTGAVGLVFFALGAKVFRNGFPRPR